MRVHARETGFDYAVDGWVRAALVHGATSFPELVRALPGVYPADALRSVRRLRRELPAGWQMTDSGSPAMRPATDNWPVEHPLDFDWRFTPEAARLLIARCQSSSAGPVAFLGAPSLVREAATGGWRSGVSLFDRNPALVMAVQGSFPEVTAVCRDLVWGDSVGSGDAAVVVADPPWYPEYTIAFLWSASRLARLGGQVLLSLAPEGTRPGIAAERDAAFAAAAAFGLRLASVKPGVLAYRTPPFERNALAAAGVPALFGDWRRGDLAVFTVADKTLVPRPAPPGWPDEWDEESVGVVRIKCRRSAGRDFCDPRLSAAVPGDILASVSRRKPARATADVWTCGNRIFRCAGTGVFRVILSAMGRGRDVERAVAARVGRELCAAELGLVRRAAGQAAALVGREAREMAEYANKRHEHGLAKAV